MKKCGGKPFIEDLKCFVDDRGFLIQLFDELKVVRAYAVSNFNKNTIRGYHKNFKEWKYFCVLKGSAKFIVAKNKKEIYSFTLSEKKPQLLHVPPEWWNGWKALECDTILLGFSDVTMKNHKDRRMSPYAFGKKIWEVEDR